MGLQAIAVNNVAVLVAAIAAYVVGALWYGPVFGKLWMKLSGITMKSTKKMPLTAVQAMTIGFFTTLLSTYVLAHFVGYLNITTLREACSLVFWLWLGFIAPLLLGSVLWEGKSFKLWLLNAAHWYVSLYVMAAVLVAWL